MVAVTPCRSIPDTTISFRSSTSTLDTRILLPYWTLGCGCSFVLLIFFHSTHGVGVGPLDRISRRPIPCASPRRNGRLAGRSLHDGWRVVLRGFPLVDGHGVIKHGWIQNHVGHGPVSVFHGQSGRDMVTPGYSSARVVGRIYVKRIARTSEGPSFSWREAHGLERFDH